MKFSLINYQLSLKKMIEEFKVIALIEGLKIDDVIAIDLKQQLLKALDQSKKPLQFENFLWVVEGWVELNCSNQDTINWLQNDIEIFVSYNKLNKYKINFHRLGLYEPLTLSVPNYGQKFDVVKQKLEHQNPDLKTKQWRLVKEKIYMNRNKISVKKFLFEADLDTIKYLEGNSFKLYLQFGMIEVRRFDDTVYKCDSKKELIASALKYDINSYFGRDDLRGKFFLTEILNEFSLARWEVKPLRFTFKIMSP